MMMLLLLLLLTAATPHLSMAQTLRTGSQMCKSIIVNQGDYQRHRNVSRLYRELQARIAGCQYIHGDLIIEKLGIDHMTEAPLGGEDIRSMSTDFLDPIVEITGRLLVSRVNLRILALRNLRAIRGYNQMDESPFHSMEVRQSPYPMELQLPSLSAILQGSVQLTGVLHQSLYCGLTRRVDWHELFQSRAQHLADSVTRVVALNYSSLFLNASDACVGQAAPDCDPACPAGNTTGRRLCWSAGPKGCQSSHRCLSRSCYSGACFRGGAEGSEECCHPSCLGGCLSNTPRGCLSCREVSLDGSCSDACPFESYYDPGRGVMVQLNGSMLRVGNICVKSCPAPFLASSDGRYCLSECPPNQLPLVGSCKPCDGAGPGACKVCDLATGILTDLEADRLRADGCAIWRAEKFLDADADRLTPASMDALGQLRYLYGGLLVKNARGQPGLDFLANLTLVSGNFALMNTHTSYLGMANLNSAKSLVLSKVSGLCPAWYPTARLAQLHAKFPISELSVSFNNVSAECLAAECHPECRSGCWGPGRGLCVECRGYRLDGGCYATCGEVRRYALNATACGLCHRECGGVGLVGGCRGPADTDCVACRGLSERGACVANCSRGLRPDSLGRCYSSAWVVGVCVGVGLLLLLAAALPLSVLHYRRRICENEIVDLDEYLMDPSSPNDMAKLLIVNDDDVVKQKEIGSGAFGTVYKGILRSNTVRGIRELPVAIKVLRGRSPKLGQELLNEASVLARVRHKCCIRLVALCLTEEPQLITALMPRGCLLEFVRARRHRISAQRMLRWFQQVAQGMAYLQSVGIVHRDLAARNVLLQTPDQVRITDFGLARLLDLTEREFANTSGLLPVKWLGLESIEAGVFSHRSDVWSYGVLLWEVCTFGESPYCQYGIRSVDDMLSLLRKGIRLGQPDTCSVDFYNMLLSCWLPYPESRPTFTDLVESAEECLRTPEKFIAAGAGVGGGGGGDDFSPDDASRADDATAATAFETAPEKRVGGGQNTYIGDPTGDAEVKPDAEEEKRALLQMMSPRPQPPTSGRQDDEDDGYLVPRALENATYMLHQQPQHQPKDESVCDTDGYLMPKRK